MSERDSRGRFVKPDPMPRPFRIGDKVRVTSTGKGGSDYPFFSVGDIGVIQGVTNYSYLVRFDEGKCDDYLWQVQSDLGQKLELVEPAPDTKAEELLAAARREAGIGPDDDLANWIKGAVERLADAGEYIADMANAKEALERREKHEWTRADAAEAKLADIAAITRVMEIAKASEDPDWDFTSLMAQVIKGQAA